MIWFRRAFFCEESFGPSTPAGDGEVRRESLCPVQANICAHV
jgi:hypothetical protein